MEEPVVALPGEPEDVRPLEEELSLLRKEQGEPAQVDLLVVRFDLGEVGVGAQIEGQVGGQRPSQIGPRFDHGLPPWLAAAAGPFDLAGFAPLQAQQRVGGKIEGPAGLDPVEGGIGQLRWLGVAARPAGRYLGPDLPFARPGQPAVHAQPHHDPPTSGLEAQGGKRDAYLGRPAAFRPDGGAVPVPVPAPVPLARVHVIGDRGVAPGGRRRGVEPECVPIVVEAVHDDAHRVVAAVAVAIQGADPHLLGIVVEQDRTQVEVAAVVADPDLRALPGSCAPGRLVHDHRKRGDGLPGGLVGTAVEGDGAGQPRDRLGGPRRGRHHPPRQGQASEPGEVSEQPSHGQVPEAQGPGGR